MLLDYLFENFYDEVHFLKLAAISQSDFDLLTSKRIMPAPSYVVSGTVGSNSFIGEYDDNVSYRFHLRGHLSWLEETEKFDINSEERAKDFFRLEYSEAYNLFFSGEMGKAISELRPDITKEFSQSKFEATWNYFLEGVYGVCTRSGRPKDIFLKQALVLFIDRFCEFIGDEKISSEQRILLSGVVDRLDGVESEFAPHEITISSRQRCIIDIRHKYLNSK